MLRSSAMIVGVAILSVCGAFACSGGDPGALEFRDVPNRSVPVSGAQVGTPPTGSSNTTDAGGTTTPAAVDPFAGAPAYASGTASGSSKQGAHPGDGNPAGLDCLTCHKAGGEASSVVFGFGGTVFTSSAGTAPVPNAEVRVVDATGKELAKVYSDALGNFWSPTLPTAGSHVGIRNAATKKMTGALSAQDGGCQKAGCHVAGAANRLFLP